MTPSSNARRGLELVIGAGIASLLTIAAIIDAGRVLGPAEYADFSAGLAIIYLVTLALSPLIPTVARVVAKDATSDRHDAIRALRSGLRRFAGLGALIALVIGAVCLFPLASWLRLRSPVTLLWALLTTITYVIVNIDRGFLQGLFRFRAYNINNILESAVRALLVFGFIRMVPTAWFAMVSWAAGILVALIAILIALRAESGGPAKPEWSELLDLLRPMTILMLSLAVFQNTDVIAVKRFLTAEQAGAYGAASALTRGFGVLFVPLYAMAGPVMTEARERGRSVFRATLRFSGAYLGLVALPLIVVAVWRSRIVTLLYGNAYAIAGDVLLPLCGVAILTYVALMLAQGLVTVRDDRFTWIYLAGAIAQIAGLAIAHDTYRQVLTVLYVCQGATLLLVTIVFLNSQKMTRDGSSSRSA